MLYTGEQCDTINNIVDEIQKGSYARHAAIWGLGGPGRADEITFYADIAARYGDRVLAPMCATGEIAIGIAECGYHVTAVDIEPEMIAVARERNTGNSNPVFINGDIRYFNLDAKDFHFAFCGSGDFHHFISNVEMLGVLRRIALHLVKRGGLVLELFYPETDSWYSPKQRYDLVSEPGLEAWKIGETMFDSTVKRLSISQEIFIERDNRIERFFHEVEMQLLDRETLLELLREAGFSIVAEYSGFNASLWQPGFGKWIVECVKL